MSKHAPPDKRQPRRPKKSALPKEDETLWTVVARQVTPARRMKPRVHPAATDTGDDAPRELMMLRREARVGSRSIGPAARDTPAPPKSGPPMPPPLADLDKKKVRRIARGRVEIDARLDLHGLRQHEAHAELRRFLFQCQSRGGRIVLVITGKGGPRLLNEPQDDASRSDHGVLKRGVPRWLAEPDLRAIVVGYTEAHARHGGAGALYVHLRATAR